MGLVLPSRRNMLGQLFSSVSSASKVLWKTNPVNCLWWRTLNKSFYIEKEESTNQHFWVLWTIVQPHHLKIVCKVCNYESNFTSIGLFHELSWSSIYRSSFCRVILLLRRRLRRYSLKRLRVATLIIFREFAECKCKVNRVIRL